MTSVVPIRTSRSWERLTEKGVIMPCYQPLIRIEDKKKWLRASDGHLYHPAKVQEASKILGEKLEDISAAQEDLKKILGSNYEYTTIPCGNCIGCRLEYSRQWANRGYLESKCWEQNWFITLTYDEDHILVPEEITDKNGFTYVNEGDWIGTLVPEELTAFMKSLRQIMKREYDQDGIRFMACGEYGSEGERPHYHIILFNCNFPLDSFYNPRILNKETYYQNKIVERAWGGIRNPIKGSDYVNPESKGISNISEASWNNIAYTARYITKKINGNLSDSLYAEKGQSKEFFRVSRMPGIGEIYYQQHKHEIYERDEIIIKNKEGTISSKPPLYYDKLYEKEYPERFKEVKKRRIKQMRYNQKIKDTTTSLDRLDQLEVEAEYKAEKTVKLIREFEKKGS